MNQKQVRKPLDNLNWKILQELQLNARITAVELGRRINLSASSTAERIRKLEEEGYIKGYRTVVDYDKLGLTIPVFINFKATRISHKEMLKMADDMPQVMEWYDVTGTHCSLLKVVVNTTKELETVIEKLQEFGETSTSLILSCNAVPKVVTRKLSEGILKS